VRDIDLKNRSYPLNEKWFTSGTRWLRLNQGKYEEPHEKPPNACFLYFEVADVVFGDLNGDGKEEAAVPIIYGSNCGSFFLTDTYIWGCKNGKPTLLGILKESRIENEHSILIHESVKNPVKIENGILSVTHYTDGSHGSPEFITTFRYKLAGAKVVSQGEPQKRRNHSQ
jgi:hypothetical protein